MKFKVGDKVKKINGNRDWCERNDILEIILIDNNNHICYKNLSRDCKTGGDFEECFELIEPSNIYCTCKRCECCGKIVKEG